MLFGIHKYQWNKITDTNNRFDIYLGKCDRCDNTDIYYDMQMKGSPK